MTGYVVYEKRGSGGYKRLGVVRGSSPDVVKNKVKKKQARKGVRRPIDVYPASYLSEFTPADMSR